MQDIVVAFGSPEDSKRIKSILMRSGFHVSFACTSGARALAAMEELQGGIIVCGYKLQDMRYSELVEDLPPYFKMLLITSTGRLEEEEIPRGVQILTLPMKAPELTRTLERMLNSLQDRRRREKSRKKIHSEAELRTISEAKERLMRKNNMTEPEAHKYLQKCAMDSGTNIVETAEMLLMLMGNEN